MQTNYLQKKYHSKATHQNTSQLSQLSSSSVFRPKDELQKSIEPLTVMCPSHTPQILTNYCSNPKCLQPLCPDCIQPHMEQHKQTSKEFPQIESIKQVRVKCAKKLQKLLQDLMRQMNGMDPPKSMEKIKADANFQLQTIKQLVVKTVDQYFFRLEEDLKYRVDEAATLLRNIEGSHLKMNKMLQELRNLDAKVKANDPATPGAIRQSLEINNSSLISIFNKELLQLEGNRKKIEINLVFDQQRFRTNIDNTIKVEMIGSQNGQSTPSTMHIQNYSVQGKSPLLHFFEVGSPKLHTIQIPNLNRKEITLKEDWQVPQFHSSILLSNREIWMTGGTYIGQEGEVINERVSKFELNKTVFDWKFTSIKGRSSHSMCECDGFVYLLGGYNKMKANCRQVERIQIATGKVTVDARPKYGGSNISVVKDKMIFKVSKEGVEYYSSKKDYWSQLQVPDLVYLQMCAGSIMNNDEIFVFGGYLQAYQNAPPVKTSYVIDISDLNQLCIKDQEVYDLPQPGGFRNNGPTVIFQRELYALQNIELADQEDGQYCSEDKTLVKFNGRNWIRSHI